MSLLPSLDSLPNNRNLLSGLFGEMVKLFRKPDSAKGDSLGKAMLILLTILSIMLVLATEPLKVIFRKKIGLKALDMGGIIFSCGFYFSWGIANTAWLLIGTINEVESPFQSIYWTNPIILFVVSAFYLIFPFYILFLAMEEHYRAKSENSEDWNDVNYRGDSVLMEKYRKLGWSQQKTWYSAEPKTAFKWGVLFTIIHPALGLPIIFTAISFWANEWFHGYYKPSSLKEQLQNNRLQEQASKLQTSQLGDSNEKFYVK